MSPSTPPLFSVFAADEHGATRTGNQRSRARGASRAGARGGTCARGACRPPAHTRRPRLPLLLLAPSCAIALCQALAPPQNHAAAELRAPLPRAAQAALPPGQRPGKRARRACSTRGPAVAHLRGPEQAAVVSACVSPALAHAVEDELAALNFSFLANDCAQAFYIAQTADGAWGESQGGSLPSNSRPSALERLTERLAEALSNATRPCSTAVRMAPAGACAAVREGRVLGLAERARNKRRRRGGGNGGVLGETQVVVLRKNCYRLCAKGGDFFGRTPSRSTVRYLYDHSWPQPYVQQHARQFVGKRLLLHAPRSRVHGVAAGDG